MYCSTCELEIKGDDKQTCPICGAALTSGGDSPPQDQAAIHDIIDDINSLIESEDTGAAQGGIASEDVFVLREYDEGSSAEDADESDSQPPGEQPLFDGDPGPVQEQPAAAFMDQEDAHVSVPSGDEDSGIADAIGLSVLHESSGENREDDGPGFLADFEEDDALPEMPPPAGGSRRSVFLFVVLVILLAAAGFYAYSKLRGSDDGAMVRTETPFSLLPLDDAAQPPAAGQAEDAPVTESARPQGRPAAEEKTTVQTPGDQPQTAQQQTAAPAKAQPAQQAPEPVPPQPAQEDAPVTATTQPVKPTAQSVSEQPVDDSGAPVTAAPEAAPAVKEPPPKQAVMPPPFYTVHAGSYRNRGTAEAEAGRFRAKGHDAFIERVDLGRRGVWFRVKVGRFKTKAEAEAYRKSIHKVLVPDSMVVLHRAG